MRHVFGLALVGLMGCGGDDSTITASDSGNPGNDANNGMDAAGGSDTGNGMDSSNADTAPGPDAAAFNVKGVMGLSLWLRGDMGITADSSMKVGQWADQSGNMNNFSENRCPTCTNKTPDDLRPTAVASGINTLPTVRFASYKGAANQQQGEDLSAADSATLEWGTGDFTVLEVAKYTNDPTSKTGNGFAALFISIYGPPETATAGIGLYGNVPTTMNNATSSGIEAFLGGQPAAVSMATGYNNGMPHVFGMQRTGTSLTVRIDGAVVGTQTIVDIDTGKTGARLGACENATAQRLEGDIGEVIAVKGTIAASDLSGLEGYLKARYATP